MAIQVIQGSSPSSRIGQSLQAALQNLAQSRMQQLQNSPIQRLFQQIGIPNESARALADLDPKSRALFLQNPGAIESLLSSQQPQFGPQDILRILQPELAAQSGQGMPQVDSGALNQLMRMQQGGSPAASLMGAQPQVTGFDQQSTIPQELQNKTTEELKQLLAQLEGGQQGGQLDASGKAKKISSMFTSPQQAIAQETLQLKKESQRLKESESEFKQQQTLKPFLDAENTSFKNTRTVQKISKKMLDLLRNNRSKFDNLTTQLKGLAPVEAQKLLVRDPVLREYMALGNNLVTAVAGTRKGQPTNFKIKFEAGGKPDISMPFSSQENLLENYIKYGEEASQVQDYMESLKDPKTGNYPLDIAQKLAKFDRAQEDPLSYPEVFKEGTRYWDDNDVPYIIKNGEWVEVK